MSQQPVQLKVLDDRIGREIAMPTYATDGSAGLDLRACLEGPLTLAPAVAQAGEEIYASYGESYWKARGIDPETGKPLPAPAPAGAPSASDL